LSSLDPQPPDSQDKTDSTSETQGKQKWSMTPAAFDKLLVAFSPDREEAGREYERVRTKLIRYFEWRTVVPGDDWADETFNRVARRIDDGKVIDELIGFIFGVARHVCQEAIRDRDKDPVSLDETYESQYVPVPDPVEPGDREDCFERCMENLLPENRGLILEYYQEERRARIQLRQRIAERLRIPLNALRIRAHRIRMSLEECIKECLETRHVRNK
jgi:DNA-directed RNA polymerase specialized sigma24 family protein